MTWVARLEDDRLRHVNERVLRQVLLLLLPLLLLLLLLRGDVTFRARRAIVSTE